MEDREVYLFLKGVFVDVFERSDIDATPALTARDVVGWDSFKQVEIVLRLEEQYGIRIRTKELNDVNNVGDLVALVLHKVHAGQ